MIVIIRLISVTQWVPLSIYITSDWLSPAVPVLLGAVSRILSKLKMAIGNGVWVGFSVENKALVKAARAWPRSPRVQF